MQAFLQRLGQPFRNVLDRAPAAITINHQSFRREVKIIVAAERWWVHWLPCSVSGAVVHAELMYSQEFSLASEGGATSSASRPSRLRAMR